MAPLKIMNKLETRVKAGKSLDKIPTFMKNVVQKPMTLPEWRKTLKNITEAIYQRFWFYHPVKCSPTNFARKPVMRSSTEIYKCPDGTKKEFKRFLDTKNFFKYRYGRGGEFAQALYAILRHIGVRCRLVVGYWGGADALWVEAWNPWTKRWISLDPAFKHGYGHKFPKKRMMGVIAKENENSEFINRTKYYKRV